MNSEIRSAYYGSLRSKLVVLKEVKERIAVGPGSDYCKE